MSIDSGNLIHTPNILYLKKSFDASIFFICKGSCTLHKSIKHIVDIFGFATCTRKKNNSNKIVWSAHFTCWRLWDCWREFGWGKIDWVYLKKILEIRFHGVYANRFIKFLFWYQILNILSETDWGAPITEIRLLRNKLCELLNIKPPVSTAIAK